MIPRPVLHDTFNLTYCKIPILALGREVYYDTSIILEALEHSFPFQHIRRYIRKQLTAAIIGH